MLALPHRMRDQRAYALIMAMVFMGVSVMMLAGLMSWISTSGRILDRNIQFQRAVAASESAIEKALTAMTAAFITNGQSFVYSSLYAYRLMVPTSSEDPAWGEFVFTDEANRVDRITITLMNSWAYGQLQSRYRGLYAYHAKYRLSSIATVPLLTGTNLSANAVMEVEFVSIPLCQYQAFYAGNLEVNPGANLTLNGRVHCNGSLYAQPNEKTLTFARDVTSAGDLVLGKHPDDPVNRTSGQVIFQGQSDGGTCNLQLPVHITQQPDPWRIMVEPPPAGESLTSLSAQQRLYNQVDMVIVVTDTNVIATSGSYNAFASTVSSATTDTFLSVSNTFFDARENRLVKVVELDMQKFIAAMPLILGTIGRNVQSLYIANRMMASTNMPAVRLVNAGFLPDTGFTLATSSPLYIKGDYNVPALRGVGTAVSAPSALLCDSVTVLSANWNDRLSDASVEARRAVATQVNAALIAGTVSTGGGYYSGGLENAIRLLEDWSGVTITLNGSLAVCYESRVANSPWGALDSVYRTPTRVFNWNSSVINSANLPPDIPSFRSVIKTKYYTQ